MAGLSGQWDNVAHLYRIGTPKGEAVISPGSSYLRLGERAVQMAQPGDIILSCGKGHEQSMCFGTVEYPWDDRTAMRAALSELLSIPGPDMPVLPTSKP